MISAIILAKNEEKNIEACISSLAFVSEIIIIDDYSTDKTADIAKKMGATVIPYPVHEDFSVSRNLGIKKATHDWVLFIDADERVSASLQKSIQSAIKESDACAFYIPRRDFFWKRELKYGETRTARNKGIIRLIKKNSGSWQGKVHEVFVTTGKTALLNGFLDHYPHQTIISFLRSINEYSSRRAEELASMGVKQSPITIFINPLFKFIYTYFFKLGFLDGPSGFVYSLMMSFHSFLVRGKLYIHQKTGESYYRS